MKGGIGDREIAAKQGVKGQMMSSRKANTKPQLQHPLSAEDVDRLVEMTATKETSHGCESKAAQKRVQVKLPPIFSFFSKEEPPVNPHYNAIRAEQATAITQFCNLSDTVHKIITRCDFAYFSAISAPDAALDGFQIISDWGAWVFPFDDLLDEGKLGKNPAASRALLQCLLSIMQEEADPEASSVEKPLIVQWHDGIWNRLVHGAPKAVQRRFAKAMEEYAYGAQKHVETNAQEHIPDPEEMLKHRIGSAGVPPLMALFEYAMHLRIPDEVFEHPAIQEIQTLGSEFVLIVNDMLSYPKEEADGVVHNLVSSLRIRGYDAQGAFDEVGAMLESRERRWKQALDALPRWGKEVDAQVCTYIGGVWNITLANLYWSFRTGRYFRDPSVVKETELVEVLENPSYLQSMHA